MKSGMAECLAFSQWADLQFVENERRLADEVLARLARAESRRFLIEPFSVARARVELRDDEAGDRHGPATPSGLWMPPAGAPDDTATAPREDSR
jgi:hypothetical protein